MGYDGIFREIEGCLGLSLKFCLRLLALASHLAPDVVERVRLEDLLCNLLPGADTVTVVPNWTVSVSVTSVVHSCTETPITRFASARGARKLADLVRLRRRGRMLLTALLRLCLPAIVYIWVTWVWSSVWARSSERSDAPEAKEASLMFLVTVRGVLETIFEYVPRLVPGRMVIVQQLE